MLQQLQALRVVLRQTWPRVSAHAQTLWAHLAEQHQAAEASKQTKFLPGEQHDGIKIVEQRDGGNHAENTEEDAKMHSMQLREKSESVEDLAEAIVGLLRSCGGQVEMHSGNICSRPHLRSQSACCASYHAYRLSTPVACKALDCKCK